MKEAVYSPLAVIMVETVELAISTGHCILITIRMIGLMEAAVFKLIH
jgi:hypothetical protein